MVIRVAIADDHPVVLMGLEQALAGLKQLQVVGLCGNSTALAELLSSHRVDVVVTDFSMAEGRYGDGLTMLRFLRRRFPQLKLVVLTGVESAQVMREIQRCDVHVILAKADHHEHLESAIHHAYERKPFLSPKVSEWLASLTEADTSGSTAQLTKREAEVVRMLAEGLSIQEAGERVGRSRKTISSQKNAAMKKLGLESDADLYRYALTVGLVGSSQAARATQVEDHGPDDGRD